MITINQYEFLVEMDGMIESTEEFIRDDELTKDNDPEGRLKDLAALNHVRNLWTEVFKTEPTDTPAELLVQGLGDAFSYTGDNNRDLISDSSFPIASTVEELQVEFAYQFLITYITHNEELVNNNLKD